MVKTGDSGQVTLGIVNQEQQQTRYTVEMKINGQEKANLWYQGQALAQLEGIELQQGGKVGE